MRHRSRAARTLTTCPGSGLILGGLATIVLFGAAPTTKAAAATATPGAPAAGMSAGVDVSAAVSGLRNGKGRIMACLTDKPATFPDCKKDPAARKLIVPAQTGGVLLDFGPLPAGTYAISLFHDENGNGRLDTMMLIPREGFGFSRDAPVRFGPPRFAAAAFVVGAAPVRQSLRVRYML